MKKEDKKLLEAIVAGMQERKAKRVVTVDMTKLDAPCQYFVICEGDSNVHVSSIAMEVKDYVRKNASEKPFATDGFEIAASLVGVQEEITCVAATWISSRVYRRSLRLINTVNCKL